MLQNMALHGSDKGFLFCADGQIKKTVQDEHLKVIHMGPVKWWLRTFVAMFSIPSALYSISQGREQGAVRNLAGNGAARG